MTINVLIDVSGSMCENGKEAIVKYLIYAMNGYIKENMTSSVRLFQWDQNIREIESPTQIEFSSGKTSERIVEFLNKNNGELHLVVTDGGFSRIVKNELKKIENRKNIYYIGIGCDCNLPSLRSVADLEHIYSAQDIITCLKKMEYLEIELCS